MTGPVSLLDSPQGRLLAALHGARVVHFDAPRQRVFVWHPKPDVYTPDADAWLVVVVLDAFTGEPVQMWPLDLDDLPDPGQPQPHPGASLMAIGEPQQRMLAERAERLIAERINAGY